MDMWPGRLQVSDGSKPALRALEQHAEGPKDPLHGLEARLAALEGKIADLLQLQKQQG